MFVITWKSGPEKGYSDFLPASWFAARGRSAHLAHDVGGPKKGRYVARCSLDVRAKTADLDYGGAHKRFNYPNFVIGTLRLVFADADRRALRAVQWRDAGKGKTFSKADVEISETDTTFEELGDFNPRNKADGRRRIERLVTIRQGQPMFRAKLMEAYERRCAVTGSSIEETLEAAHISPYRGTDSNHVRNGLLLRADIHTLFDLGLIRIDAKGRIKAEDHIREVYKLPEQIFMPRLSSLRPEPVALGEKYRQRPIKA
jgi:hypothetical protein